MGRKTFSYWRRLNSTQWWEPERLRAWQESKLRELFRTAAQNCPYYRELFASRGVDPAAEDPLSNLARLPLMSKATIRAHRDAMTNTAVPGGVLTSNTGGSTGEPLVFNYDRRRVAYDKAARMRAQQWFRIRPGDRQAWLWGAPAELSKQDRLRQLRDRLTNELLLSAFDLSRKRMREYLDRLEAFNPASLYGYPSSLALLAAFGRSVSRNVCLPNLRAIFVSGEVLDDHQREAISEYFRVPVANDYGAREAGFLSHECPMGGMHIMSEYAVVEIVDDRGRPVPTGESGEIVITHLDAHAMPFIRYRTEDIGRLSPEKCSCGRSLPLMDVVAGRRTDHLVAADGTLAHALSLIYVLREMASVQRFQIRQGIDRDIDIHIVPDGGFTAKDRRHLEAGVRRRLGEDIQMRVRLVNRIATTPSGKHRYVTSEAIVRGRDRVESADSAAPCSSETPLEHVEAKS